MDKMVYSFGAGSAEGRADMRNLLGGKGANLAEMSSLGLPVPPGFTITTEVCTAYTEAGNKYPDGLDKEVIAAISTIENEVGAKFGDAQKPLLVSVRSGARASMPGMMDTVLNLGLNDDTVQALAQQSGNQRFAFDSYRRFIQMYSDVVLGVDHAFFEDKIDEVKRSKNIHLDTELSAEDLAYLVEEFQKVVQEETDEAFPQDVHAQLWGAIGAVFGSWMNQRAITYRKLNDIPAEWGTAVNVQAMVFGNMGQDSATGVAFTRDPSTGERIFFGEYLINAQGEDVVAGIRTPQHLTKLARERAGDSKPSMEETLPEVFTQLVDVYQKLEAHYRDMQDIEFTVQQGRLWMLQTRAGKRTTKAALRIAVEMCGEGLIEESEAVCRIDPAALDQLLHPTLDPDAPRTVIAKGLPASPGAASGKIVFTADEAEISAKSGEKVILVRIETSPEDIHGMHAAQGILTTRGGMTSHAAVVARGMGRPCVSGAGGLQIDDQAETLRVAGYELNKGEIITIDGATGEVMIGAVPTVQPELSGDFATLMQWADRYRRLKIRTNAETPTDARTAIEFGAEGIGLCRTEHMFFDADRILAVREMIMADNEAGRRAALKKILPMQRQDFVELFEIMGTHPVTIRLLDPPLHEFLPKTQDDLDELAKAIGGDRDKLRRRAHELEEFNPMLGHRGCRLGISYPEIYEIQAQAIFEAALLVSRTRGDNVAPEVMLPLIATGAEFQVLKRRIDAVAETVEKEQGQRPHYDLGTMIELPRAALRAGEIAQQAEFFSFGTNDLTQTAYGISRDDASNFLENYRNQNIIAHDPFVTIDQDGVGELVEIAAERGRQQRPDIKLGICGEHGGDPASVNFCHAIGLDYVSCSPYRVPIARLAAAQAAINDPMRPTDQSVEDKKSAVG